MNLWLRLIWLLLSALWRPRLAVPGDASRLDFRVWFHDLDTVGHMNNGRYLTLMDQGRFDLMLRSGLVRAALANKWTPIASAIAIRYRRELRLFQKFRLQSRIIYWSETLVVMEQVFIFDGGKYDGQVAARALFKGGLYERAAKSFVPIARLMEATNVSAQSPPPTAEVSAFLAADNEMQRSGRSQV